jgi:hypothetical protein
LPKGSAALICNWTSWPESGPFWSTTVQEYFVRSLDRARAQRAPAWELRTAISIALLKREQGQTEKGREVLLAAYARFTEELDTADLKRARRLLDELGSPRLARLRRFDPAFCDFCRASD